jgi:hypothetical protein
MFVVATRGEDGTVWEYGFIHEGIDHLPAFSDREEADRYIALQKQKHPTTVFVVAEVARIWQPAIARERGIVHD